MSLTDMLEDSETKDTPKIMMYREFIEKMQSFIIEIYYLLNEIK
jgi:hypothetical protein